MANRLDDYLRQHGKVGTQQSASPSSDTLTNYLNQYGGGTYSKISTPAITGQKQKTLYDQWKESLEKQQREYEEAQSKLGFWDKLKGTFGAIGQGIRNQITEAENNPYAGYMTDNQSAAQAGDTRTLPTTGQLLAANKAQNKANEAAAQGAYGKLKALEGQGGYYAMVTSMLGSGYHQVGPYVEHLQEQLETAKRNGDVETGRSLSSQLAIAMPYYQEQQDRQMASRWMQGQQSDFEQYRQALERYGGAENVGKVARAMANASEDDYDRMWSQYGDILPQYEMYGDTTLGSDAAYRAARKQLDTGQKQWDTVSRGKSIAMSEVEDYAYQMRESGEWTLQQAMDYIEQQQELADNPQGSEAEIQAADKALRDAQKVMQYATEHRYDDIQTGLSYKGFGQNGLPNDFLLKADEGQQLFEQEKDNPIVSEKDREAFEQFMEDTRATAAEVTSDEDAYNWYVQSEAEDWMRRYGYDVANASYLDPRYNTGYMEPDERWTELEKRTFYYLYATDRAAANEYGANVNREHNAEDAGERDLKTQEYATRNFGTGVLSSLKSVAGHLATGTLDFLRMAAENSYRGDLYETQYQGLSRDADVATAAIAQDLNEKGTLSDRIPVLGGKGLGDAYQLMMSMVESGASIATGGEAGSLAMFFGMAASSATRDALNRGLDADHALLTGFVNGVAEVAGETFSVENLLSNKGLEDFLRKGVLRESMKQGGIEASEEMFTTILNTMADAVINGDKSELAAAAYRYRLQGMNPDEADKQALKDWLNQLGADAVGGFLSGTIMSGGRYGTYAVPAAVTTYQGQYGQEAAQKAAQGVMDYASLMDPNSEAGKAAAGAQGRYQKKGTISNLDFAKIMSGLQNGFTGEELKSARRVVGAFASGIRQAAQDAMQKNQAPEESLAGENQMETDSGTGTPGQDYLNYRRLMGWGTEETTAGTSSLAGENTEVTDAGTGTVQQATAEDLQQAQAVLDWLEDPGKEVPVEGLTQEDAEKLVLDLAQQLGANLSAQPGLQIGQTIDRAIARVRQVIGSLQSIDNRRSEREARETRQHTVTKADAETIETGDGTGTIVSAQFNTKTGNMEFTVQKPNGQRQTIQRSQLNGEANEVFEILEGNLGQQAAEAFNQMQSGQNAWYYASDFWSFRELGRHNGNLENALNDSRIRGVLTEAQARYAYTLGQGMTNVEGGTPIRNVRGTGRVTLDGGMLGTRMLKGVKDKAALQRSQDFKEIEAIAKALEIDVVFYESETDSDRYYVGAQGAYYGGKIYLDVNAGMVRAADKNGKGGQGKRIYMTVMSHELTHFIKDNAPERYKELQDRVSMYLMMNEGVNLADLVRSKMAREQRRLTSEAALEEVVADACETMLASSQAVQELAREKPGLFGTIKGYIDRFANQILASHAEAKALQPIIKEIQEIWDNALKEAVANRGLAVENPGDTVVNGKGAVTNDATGTAMASTRTYEESGKTTLQDFLNKRIEDKALTKEEAQEILDQLDELYRICKDYDNGQFAPFSAWSNAEVVTYDGRPVFSVVKANGEYKLNLDFSLVCKKRRTLDAVFNEMISQGIMDDFDMVQESIAKINDIIRENGFETACGLCFVDSKRYRQGMIADAFVMMYNTQVSSLAKKGQKVDYFNYGGDQTIQNSGEGIDTLPDEELNWKTVDEILKTAKPSTVKWKIANYLKNNPSARRRVRRGDFMSTAGFDALNAQNPELLSLYNSKKGAGGPKAAQSDVQYLNEIIGSKAFNAKAAYEVGGVRIQSFSDYVGRLVFDYVQMVADLSAKQLPAHSYTKEFMFAQQFGLTGIKINMSLVPEIIKGGVAAGLDANGNYAWKDGQSFGSTVYDNNGKRLTAAEGFELAKKIQNAEGYSLNCGTIAVGVSDEHINKMLDDPEIRMIIPYHKSSLNHIVAAMMNIDAYTDYTLQQNTRQWNGKKWVNIARSGEFNFNEALQRLGDAKAAADEYLDWCKENGYKPKFDQFAGNPNYYKLLEDYSCYDKDGKTNAPMGAVQMRFPTESDAFGPMKDLIAQGLEEDAILQAKQEKAVPEIVKQIQSVLPEFEGNVRERNAKKKKASQKSEVKLSERDREELSGVTPDAKTIAVDMTDEERYQVLKDKKITVYPYNQERFSELEADDYAEVERALQGEYFNKKRAFELLRKLGTVFSTFKDYYNKDISVSFEYSLTSMRHSNNKQDSNQFASFVKMLTIFDRVIDTAVGLEAHSKRYEYEKQVRSNLDSVYVLFGAFKDGNEIVPVRAEVKVFTDSTQAKLDVVIALSKINEADVIRDTNLSKTAEISSPRPASIYNIAGLLRNVNPEDTGLLKYVPDGFLDEERLAGKQQGLERTAKYIAEKDKRRVKLSERENLGYHAGDLGKAEHLNIQGRYRGTGHFGTGTYFVGEEEKVTKDSHYGKRPQHAVYFTDYNLFKVRDDRDGYRLHEFLRIIDGGVNRDWIQPALENQFSIINPTGYYDLARSKYGEEWASGDNLLNAMLEYAADNGIEVKTLDEYKAGEGKGLDDSDVMDYYTDYVKDTVKEEIDNANAEYRKFMDAVFDIHLFPGFTRSKILSALTAVADYQDVTPRNARVDSYATVFMKAMGYEGVDVRGTRLDNTEYGSVIYDVKPETVKYSERDVDSFTTKADIDAEIDRVQDLIRDIQNAQWNARDAAKADPRVQEAQERMWKAEDEKGRVGSLRERMEYNRILKQVKEEQAAQIPEGDLNELAQRVMDLKALREQFLKVTPITTAQYNKLAKHFGTTTDYEVAGFILLDGRMLDFSGKKQYGSAYAGGREVYHNEVGDVLNLPTDTSPRIDMVSNGNIRLVPEINGINLSQKPTAKQKEALRGFIEYHNGSVHVDIDNAAGRTIESFGYYNGTSASKVLADIDSYFETGEAPAPVSNLRAFYSMRDDARSDRELLMGSEANLTAAERKALESYQARVRDFEAREQKVQAALAELDRLTRTNASRESIQKQRTKVSNLQAGMNKALRELTQAETGDKTILEIIRKEREIQRRRTSAATRETFTKRELRGRITRLYNDLNRRITSPSEKKNIPVPVMMQAIEVLEAINMDSSREGSKAGQKLRDKLLELQAKYRELENDQDFRNAAVYDETIAELLKNMIEVVGDTPINRMSARQMKAVYDALTALDKTARQALKIRMLGEERDAYEVAMQMAGETKSVEKPKQGLLSAWLNAQLSPERMFNRLGGYHKNSAWSQVYRMLNDGQLKATQIMMEGSMLFGDLLNGKGYDRFIDPKHTVDIGLKDENGKAIPITHGMMVALYMHLQNEQNTRHIAHGGLTVPNLRDYYNNKNGRGIDRGIRAVGVSQEIGELRDQRREAQTDAERDAIDAQIREAEERALEYVQGLRESIERQLTDYDRQWIAAAKELFDQFSKEKLNETTMDVYGIKRANVEHYFPIWVDGDFLNTPFESIAKDMSLENAGFMKERVDSGKPIRLADVSDVANSQLRRVSQYCGLMPVTRNFQKIWGKVQTGYRSSLQNEVRQKFGENGLNYVENLMADLNGARRQQEGAFADFFNTVRGNMAQASLTLSLRTAMGQTASYPTAASVVGWKALGKALARGGRNNTVISRADQELIRKYSPLLWYRMKGYSTTELGDIANANNKWSRLWKKMRWATGWIQAMDGATVGRLWYAAEYYVQDKNKALKKGTNAYYQEVAKVFNDVVERTQPDYTTMQRPDILRNPNALVKQLTMFLTQRLQNFNILYDAVATQSQMQKDLKAKRNGVTAADVQQARQTTARAVVSQIAAAATITAFKFAADLILHSLNAYRDDDDELTDESISRELLDMFLDSLAGNALGGGEVYDLIEKYAFGKTYYGIEVSGVSTVTDVVESVNNFLDEALKDDADWSKLKPKADRLAKNLASLMGIPYSNAQKIVMGLVNHGIDIKNGEFGHFEAGVERTTAQQAHRLYRAYTASNFGTAKQIREQVGDDEKLNQALVTYIKQQFKDGSISQSKAAQQLVKFAGKDQKAAEKTMREYACEVETGIKFDNIGDELAEGNITEAEAARMYQKYGGKTAEEAKSKAAFAKYQGQHPNTVLEATTFQTYYTKYRSYLSAEQYESYYTAMKACKGTDKDGDGKTDSGSKKAEQLLVINRLPISSAEKDAIYKLNGWSEKTIKDAPWHK